MKLFHITKQGNLHFQLKDGRLAAIYPKTGYVRVSHSLKNFTKTVFAERVRLRYDNAVRLKNPGSVAMYQINPVRKVKKLFPVNRILYYKNDWSDNKSFEMYKYPNKVFYECETTERVLYPNNLDKLHTLLTNFENKNCK